MAYALRSGGMGDKPKVPFLDLARFLRISRIKAAKTHGFSPMGIRPPNEENIMAADFDNRSPNSVENSNGKKSILSNIGVWTGSLPWIGLVFFVIALMGCTGGNALAITSFNQGVENSNLNQYDKAITDYTRAIELDPKSAIAYTARGLAYLKVGKQKEAEADFAKAKMLNGEN